MVAGAAVIYGCFALAAELNSWLPVFVIYAIVGLAAVGLPLRLFPLTVRVTIMIWLVACAVSLTYHFSKSDLHSVMVTALVVAAACGLSLHSGVHAVQSALDDQVTENRDNRPKAVLVSATIFFAIAVGAGAVALSTLLIPSILLRFKSWLLPGAAITAAAAVALGLLIAVITGLIDGTPRISTDTPAIDPWRGYEEVNWRVRRTIIRRRRIHTIVDRMGEVLRHALIRLADALRILSTALARTMTNLFFSSVRLVVNGVIRIINFTLKVAILIFRSLVAGLISASWFCSHAATLVSRYLFYAIMVAGLPVAALFIGAVFTSISAEETLRYLIAGSLLALLRFGICAVVGIALLAIAWSMLASQRLRLSLESFRRSVSITAPYGLLLVAIGRWVVGLPGTFGHGRIHVGLITFVSTGILVFAFVWSQFINRSEDESAG
jgi:hypothetical protein